MTRTELLELHKLKGMMEGQRIGAKCSIQAAQSCLQKERASAGRSYHRASIRAYVRSIKSIRRLERVLDQIIKEAENAKG